MKMLFKKKIIFYETFILKIRSTINSQNKKEMLHEPSSMRAILVARPIHH